MPVESLSKHCWIRSDVILSIPSCKAALPFFSPFFSFCVLSVFLDFLAGKLGLSDIRVLPALIGTECYQWGFVCSLVGHMSVTELLGCCCRLMALCLPRRGRLGRDQLQIKPCLEPGRSGRALCTCCGSSKATARVWAEQGPLLEMQMELVGRSPSPGTCRGSSGPGIAPGDAETRKMCGLVWGSFESLWGFCWFCHCRDLQALAVLWHGCRNVLCPPQTIKPASWTKSNSSYTKSNASCTK